MSGRIPRQPTLWSGPLGQPSPTACSTAVWRELPWQPPAPTWLTPRRRRPWPCRPPRWMVAGGVIVLVTAGFVLAQHRGEPAKADAIRTAQVTRGNIVLSVSATGTVEPASMVEVRSRATGTVTRVLVDEGQRVRLGQVLVELNDPDSRHAVESYRAAARSAEAAVAVAQAKLDDLRAGGTLVITLAQVDPLYAAVNVDEADIAGVRAGMPVRLTADALPNAVIRGKVDRVAAVAQVVQNVTQFAVTVVLQEPPPGVRLGMTVDADFVTARRDNVLLVPRQAVKEGKSPTVTVIVGGELETRSVQTGLSDGHMVEIISGLREGEVVLLGSAKQPAKSSPGRSPFQPQYKKK